MLVVETGPRDGPVVVLTSGLGGAWFDWEAVTALLPDFRVLCFDRPGTGGSPPSRAVPSLRAEVDRLATLARHAHEPVTLVAHSMAAFQAEALARIHPDLVHGLVLVDPSCEPAARARVRLAAVLTPPELAFGRLLGRTGLARRLGPFGRGLVMSRVSRRGEVAPRDLVAEVYGRGEVLGMLLAENTAYNEMAADLLALRARLPMPPVPLEVLTALGDLHSPDSARRWAQCHRELAAMSPLGHQVELGDALHMVHVDEPDTVAAAIARVVSAG
ncbi:MAG: alpha/beta hydrolase [Streptosporangiaceae bacterium]